MDLCCWEKDLRCRRAAFLIGAFIARLNRIVEEDGSRFARMPNHAMRLHEWGTRSKRIHLMCGPPAHPPGLLFGFTLALA